MVRSERDRSLFVKSENALVHNRVSVPGVPACVIRRRGEVLRDAVLAATVAEVAEHGVQGASMDRIARRAGTGKAALYRRWPNVQALALDAIVTTLEAALPETAIDTGSLREDLVTSMDTLADQLRGDLGVVVRALIGEAARDPAVAAEFTERFGMRLQLEGLAQLQRAMLRGDIPAQTIDPYVMAVPAALVIHQLLFSGTMPSRAEIVHIVDAIVLPLLGQPAASLATTD
jgi:AcrR family transcriptional regulator